MRLRIPPLARRTSGPTRPSAPGARLGWLDALRGVAALIVALHHFDVLRLLPFGGVVWRNFDMGLFGVMLFFIVSGYIIPASLERRGDVRGFWIGRIFRIYPALIAAFVVLMLLLPDGDGSIALLRTGDDLVSLTANGLMLQDFLGVTNGMNVTWTLCYEMVFYFLVTALFTRGLHRQSAPIAVGFAAAALAVGTAVGTGTQLLSAHLGSPRPLLLIVTPIVLAGLAGALSGNRWLTQAGALVLGGTGLALVALNGRAPLFETAMIFATMFAGTVVYRAQHGELGRFPALLACGIVIGAGALVGPLYNRGYVVEHTWTASWQAWTLSYLGAWALFGLGFLARKRRFPKVLTWLGAISFSVYLVHIPLLHVIEPLVGVPPLPSSTPGRIAWTAIYLGAVLGLSHLMYHLVEMPMQRLGRRVQQAANRRRPHPAAATPTPPDAPSPGPASAPAPAPAPAPAASLTGPPRS
ncbi:acyltransferase family protein [Streptomyces sp. NPDC090022]|uniref:acyltransferase family protein n=1 Tax=Streptomyces sp. NPDC090022 TaxID=3365920 RepID=UPI003818F7E9